MSVSLPASHVPHSSLTLPAERTLGPWSRALFSAVERMDVEAARWALSKGADVNAHCPFETQEGSQPGTTIIRGGFTPLHDACWASGAHTDWAKTKDMVSLLLEAGADPNLAYAQFDPSLPAFKPMDLAALNPASWATDLCDWLSQHGARPSPPDALGAAAQALGRRSAR